MFNIARPVIPWVGSKEKLLPYIRKILPLQTKQYLEPFGGGGSLLMSLPPDPRRLDIYNDYNGDLVNLYLCVKERPAALMKELRFLPIHSRLEFELFKALLAHEDLYFENIEKEIDIVQDQNYFTEGQAFELLPILQGKARLFDVKRAAAYYQRVWGSYSSTTTSFGVKTYDLPRFIKRIKEAQERLQDVVIENKDGIAIIQERDRPDGTIYCDPPYYKAEKSYTEVFSKRAHVRLWEALKKCQGYVVVSYNDCPYIRNLYKDFFILAFERHNSMAQKSGAKYGELLITNFDPRLVLEQCTLFDIQTEIDTMRLVRIPPKPLKTIYGGTP